MYVPIGVPETTPTFPVATLNVSCGGTAELTLKVALVGVAANPLMVSEAKALRTFAAPVAPLMPDTLSLVATIGDATTTIITSATAQLVGFRFSQI